MLSRDSSTTTLFVVGATCGEASLPILVGFLMDIAGPNALLVSIVFFSGLCTALYLAAHVLSLQERERRRQQLTELDSELSKLDS